MNSTIPSWERSLAVLALFLYTNGLILLLRARTNGAQGNDPSEGDPLIQIIWFITYVLTILMILPRWRTVFSIASKDMLLWGLVGLAFISTLWSESPSLTLRRSTALLGTTLFGLYLASRYDLREQIGLLVWALGGAAVLSLFFALGLPTYGVSAFGWKGIFVHKNILGRIMVLGALSSVLLSGRGAKRHFARLTSILTLFLLVMSESKTSLILLLVLFVVLVAGHGLRWDYTLLLPFALVFCSIIGWLVTWVSANVVLVLETLGRDATLTGRTNIWPAVIHEINEKFWCGYGYSAFWLGWNSPAGEVWAAVGWEAPHAHSGYLDLALDVGIPGLLLFAFGFIRSYGRAISWARVDQTTVGLWPFIYLTFMLLYNIQESGVLRQNNIFWVIYVAVTFLLAGRHDNRITPLKFSSVRNFTSRSPSSANWR